MLKSRFFLKFVQFRHFSEIQAKSLYYETNGDPLKVIKQKIEFIPNKKLKPNEIVIKFKSAVIHPSDINTIQGQYPLKPLLPAICGNEGYAEVIDSGTSTNLKEGDHIIQRNMNSGTWTTHKICNDGDVIKLKTTLAPEIGAISSVNPGTAYRMLKDFTNLTDGSVIIQNGGTSAVAIYVTQLAKLWNVKSISIIRARESVTETNVVKDILKTEFGASHVLTENEVKTELPLILKETGPAKLALNCVGGSAVLPLLKALKKSGIIVTYGGMNRLPMQIPISSLIFSDIHIRGFWMSAWSEQKRDSQVRQDMLDYLVSAFHSGSLKPSPFTTYNFDSEWQTALSKSMFTDATPQAVTRKNIFIMSN